MHLKSSSKFIAPPVPGGALFMLSRYKKLLIGALLLPVLAFAYSNPGTPSGFVNDFANVISSPEQQSLEARLVEFNQATSNEVSVVTVQNLGGDTIENFSEELFKDWGIGKKGKDNGILLIVAVDDHKMRIEVGYGLEGLLTDGEASSIIRNIMTPAFRNNDFGGGISSAVNQMNLVTLQTAANAEESSSASQELAAQAQQMQSVVMVLNTMITGGKSKN